MNQALYKQVANNILEKIRHGEINIGEKLPPESELAEQLGISRSTLRLAYSQLEKSGILKRRKRGGTQVIADRPVARFNMVTNGFHDVLSLGRDTQLLIQKTDMVSGKDINALTQIADIGDNSSWLAITGTRYLPEQSTPFNWSRLYVHERFSSIRHTLGPSVSSVFNEIEAHYPVSVARVKQEVQAIACPEDAAVQIGLAAGDPALMITAMLEDANDDLMEISVAIFDPSRFSVSTDVFVGS